MSNFLKKNLHIREFRSLISMTTLQKIIGKLYKKDRLDFSSKATTTTSKKKKTNDLLMLNPAKQVSTNTLSAMQLSRSEDSNNASSPIKRSTIQLRDLLLIMVKIKKILRILKKQKFNRKNPNQRRLAYEMQVKRLCLLKCFFKINFLKNLLSKFNEMNNDLENLSLPLNNELVKRFSFLNLKRLLHLKSPYNRRLLAMRISGMKPLNVEISYKLLYAIVLYSPQKVIYPAMINLDLLVRALAKK